MSSAVFHDDNISLNAPEIKSWYSECLQIVVDENADMVIASTLKYAYKFVDNDGNIIKWQVFEEGYNAGGIEIYEKLISESTSKPAWIPDAIILK